MNPSREILIVGGGLAGLSLAILCAKDGMLVTVLEKSNYPRHKVCGEYISLESYNFMVELGLPLRDANFPILDQFLLTSHHGYQSSCALKPGGIGISRYLLDKMLYDVALQLGVKVVTDCKVTDVKYNQEIYKISTAKHGNFEASLCVGAYGRISGLSEDAKKESKFIGIKYHVDQGPAKNTIEIHNFEGGYCGISAIEDEKYCLCYLAKADGLKAYKGQIDLYEEAVLYKNPFLKKRFSSHKLIDRVATSQIFFGVNEANVACPLLGDAAGFIPPITGNGMSLAFRSAKQCFHLIKAEKDYSNLLKSMKTYNAKYLNNRINQGVFLQNLLFNQNKYFNKTLMFGLTTIPGLMTFMTKQAVGEEI